jgi:mannose-6-phosphate isomerase class I
MKSVCCSCTALVQHYDWGGHDFIPGLLGIANSDRRPFAELWLGASFRHPRYKPRESYPRLLAEILIVFPPSALALADVRVSFDEFEGANVLDHRETELCLHPQA